MYALIAAALTAMYWFIATRLFEFSPSGELLTWVWLICYIAQGLIKIGVCINDSRADEEE